MAEHKLIDGGEQWLPYARSRIKALRATGLAFASQQFVMPDGAEVKVRIEGPHEYIRLSGGNLSLMMDAGLIDLRGLSEGSPLKYAHGIRLDTVSTRDYTAGYAATTSGAYAAYLSNPTAAPAQQIVGRCTFPPFYGHLKPNGQADSFSPKRVAAEPPNDPWVESTNDSALRGKKITADGCPASMFTGRTRLYVQAMYGQSLYGYAGASTVDAPERWPDPPSLASTTPPSLNLPAYVQKDDQTSYQPVTIDTSTGVRFDPVTGKHWLINVNSESLAIYPLVSTAAGEKARKYLRGDPVTVKGTPLSADDIERLEAFVLAHSRPDVKNSFTIPTGLTSPRVAMGYGWHWNWSGTQANIVSSVTYDQGPEFDDASHLMRQAMESTHYQIALTLGADGAWSASKTIAEERTRWAVHRAYWCITAPEWADMPLTSKVTPRNTSLLKCDAPFYVFYVRDELRVCRVKITQHDPQLAFRDFSPGFAEPLFGSTIYEYTAGMLNGHVTDTSPVGPFFMATFSCGSTRYADLNMPWVASSQWITIEKTNFIPGIKNFDNTFGGSHDFISGYPPPYGSYTTVTIPDCQIEVDQTPFIYSTRKAYYRSARSSSTATIIVPFYDAEALFMEGTIYTETTDSGIAVSTHYSGALAAQTSQWRLAYSDPITGAHYEFVNSYVKYLVGGVGATLTSTNPPDVIINTVTVLGKNMVCKTGLIPAVMNDLGSYHDNSLDYATSGYSAITGSRTTSGVAIAQDHITPVGLADPNNVPNCKALVGWV